MGVAGLGGMAAGAPGISGFFVPHMCSPEGNGTSLPGDADRLRRPGLMHSSPLLQGEASAKCGPVAALTRGLGRRG
jgi:hypothetical protein